MSLRGQGTEQDAMGASGEKPRSRGTPLPFMGHQVVRRQGETVDTSGRRQETSGSELKDRLSRNSKGPMREHNGTKNALV